MTNSKLKGLQGFFAEARASDAGDDLTPTGQRRPSRSLADLLDDDDTSPLASSDIQSPAADAVASDSPGATADITDTLPSDTPVPADHPATISSPGQESQERPAGPDHPAGPDRLAGQDNGRVGEQVPVRADVAESAGGVLDREPFDAEPGPRPQHSGQGRAVQDSGGGEVAADLAISDVTASSVADIDVSPPPAAPARPAAVPDARPRRRPTAAPAPAAVEPELPSPLRKTSITMPMSLHRRLSDAYRVHRWTLRDLIVEALQNVDDETFTRADIELRWSRLRVEPSSAVKNVRLDEARITAADALASALRMSRSELLTVLLELTVDSLHLDDAVTMNLSDVLSSAAR